MVFSFFSFLIRISLSFSSPPPSYFSTKKKKRKKVALSGLIFLRHGPLSFMYCSSAARPVVNYFIRTQNSVNSRIVLLHHRRDVIDSFVTVIRACRISINWRAPAVDVEHARTINYAIIEYNLRNSIWTLTPSSTQFHWRIRLSGTLYCSHICHSVHFITVLYSYRNDRVSTHVLVAY